MMVHAEHGETSLQPGAVIGSVIGATLVAVLWLPVIAVGILKAGWR